MPCAVRTARGFARIDTSRLLRNSSGLAILIAVSLCFLAGAVVGALAGSSQLPTGETLLPGDGSVYGYDTYAGLLFSCSRYHLLVLLFSTSLLGVFLIPATLAFRGFALACSAAWLTASYDGSGAALSLIILGLPALFTVPGLFATAQWGIQFSVRFLASFTRRPLPAFRRERDNRVLAVCIMLFAAAAVEYFVVPPLVRLLI